MTEELEQLLKNLKLRRMLLRPEQSNIFFKLMEERYRRHSTIITTNLTTTSGRISWAAGRW